MDSLQVSWQWGSNVGVSEQLGVVSPSTTPPPSSPSLYQQSGSGGDGKSHSPSRAQIASDILQHLEQLEQLPINEEMIWKEESVNLGLFEELESFPLIPTPTNDSNGSGGQSGNFAHLDNNSDLPLIEKSVDLSQIQVCDWLSPGQDEKFADLNAEFMEILQSLPKDDVQDTQALTKVLEIAGIATTVVGDDNEAMIPLELQVDVQPAEFNLGFHESGLDFDEEMEVALSYPPSPTSSINSNSQFAPMALIQDEDVGEGCSAAGKILDALLVGDVSTAQAFLPQMKHQLESHSPEFQNHINEFPKPAVEFSKSAQNKKAFSLKEIENVVSPATAQPLKKRPERRGRKPGKRVSKSSQAYLRDKSLRKKEQNKSAATRYRQKKKAELEQIHETEAELLEHNGKLTNRQAELQREIQMVKQLLRDIVNVKRGQAASKLKTKQRRKL